MIKTLKITIILAAVLAGGFLMLSVAFGLRADPEITEFLEAPGAIEKFKATAAVQKKDQTQASPLVKQAQAFALVLNPPKRVVEKPRTPAEIREALRPAAPVAAKFDLIGTCFYTSQPRRSLALIKEPGKGLHWVKQSGKVGHLIIEQIKDGSLVYRDGQQTQELFCPKKKSLPKAGVSPSRKEKTRPPSLSRLLRAASKAAAKPERSRPSHVTAKKTKKPSSKQQAHHAIEWLTKMKDDPKSMGISAEEAKSLADLGEIIKELERKTSLSETTQGRPEPNSPAPLRNKK